MGWMALLEGNNYIIIQYVGGVGGTNVWSGRHMCYRTVAQEFPPVASPHSCEKSHFSSHVSFPLHPTHKTAVFFLRRTKKNTLTPFWKCVLFPFLCWHTHYRFFATHFVACIFKKKSENNKKKDNKKMSFMIPASPQKQKKVYREKKKHQKSTNHRHAAFTITRRWATVKKNTNLSRRTKMRQEKGHSTGRVRRGGKQK